MKTLRTASSPPRAFLRLLAAWAVGGALYFGTLVVADYDGINTFVTGLLFGSVVSTVGVVVCVIAGLVLRLPPLGRTWRASYAPVACLGLLGLALFAYSFSPGQVHMVSSEDGESFRELGRTWLPGYLLLLFSITHLPRVLSREGSS